MKTAVIGARGQLGTDLLAVLPSDTVALGHDDIEITDDASVRSALDAAGPECVVNCAAYNLVDRAEDEPEQAYAANALGPRNLARYCAERELRLVHVSTDYVFGLNADRTTPWRETDAPGPVSAYGTSKLCGEYFVRSECRQHFVVRTCGLYGPTPKRGTGNFVETMLRLAGERDELSVVNDQRLTPTSTADLAQAIAALVETDAVGLYQATNAGETTWYEFACEVFRQANVAVKVRPISSAEFGAKARRPAYSVLDNSKLTGVIGMQLPPWQDALARYLTSRTEESK